MDVVHGVTIEDPYRWLEDGNSPEAIAWTEAQNKRTEEVLSQVGSRSFFTDALTRSLSEDFVGSPVFRGNRLFYTKRTAGQNQPVLCMRELSGSAPERVILDPNKASARGIVALDWWYPSQDGSKLAYGYSERGDEWSVLDPGPRVRRNSAGRDRKGERSRRNVGTRRQGILLQ